MTALTPRAISVARRVSAPYCATYGRGTPLLLIHGFGETGRFFEPLVPALASCYQVIVPDLRGHGFSSRLPQPSSIAQLVEDAENLFDLLRVPSCFVLGHGTGGAVAQALAHEHPEHVRGLVLSCTYARSADNLREQIESRFGKHRLMNRPLSGGMRGTVTPQRTVLPFDSRSWLRHLVCPTLVVAGETDVVVPTQHARELVQLIPDATLRIVPKADCRLVETHTQQFLDAVLPWLEERTQ